jgi:glutamate carboxypeptidase
MDYQLYFQSLKGEMVRFLKTLVNLESPTSDKKAVDRCSAAVVKEVANLGLKIKRMPQKEIGDLYIFEYFSGEKEKAAKPLLVLAHIDTVWPVGTLNRMPFYISEDKIFGPGALDMKAGVVAAVFALKAIHNLSLKPARKIWFFLNSAEETGDEESHRQIALLAKRAGAVLCLEPALPGGALKVQRKGRLVIKIECFGKSAHASTPEKGYNAIEELIYQLNKLKKLKIPGMSLNIGLIGGGEKANVVPEKAWAIGDLRFWTSSDLDKIKAFLRELRPSSKEAKIKTSIASFTPPMEFTRNSRVLFERAKSLAAEMGIELLPGKSGGGSDASIASHLGIPALDGLGPEGEGMHAENEHLLLSSLIQRTALLTKLLVEL